MSPAILVFVGISQIQHVVTVSSTFFESTLRQHGALHADSASVLEASGRSDDRGWRSIHRQAVRGGHRPFRPE